MAGKQRKLMRRCYCVSRQRTPSATTTRSTTQRNHSLASTPLQLAPPSAQRPLTRAGMASRFAQFTASLSKSAQSLSHKLQGKSLAGKDAAGNIYYTDPSQQHWQASDPTRCAGAALVIICIELVECILLHCADLSSSLLLSSVSFLASFARCRYSCACVRRSSQALGGVSWPRSAGRLVHGADVMVGSRPVLRRTLRGKELGGA